jgi:hypothetical protein
MGLHHLCLRASSREDVDAAADKVRAIGDHIDGGPTEGDLALGYYLFVFEILMASCWREFRSGQRLAGSPDKPLIPSSDPDWNQNA